MPAAQRTCGTVLSGDEAGAEIFRDFMGIVQRQRQLMFRIFAKHGLHPTQAFCMRVLAAGETTQSELAEAMMLSRPTVTRILQRMERAGLVVRRPGELDQRQTLVALTEQGQTLQRRLGVAIAELVGATLARLPDRDREELARILPVWRQLTDEALS